VNAASAAASPGDPQSSGLDRASLAARIDHTLLTPTATDDQVAEAVGVAVAAGCASVCVAPVWVRFAVEAVGGRIPVTSVVGFPHGTSLTVTKAAEAAAVVALGASEVDVVADLAAVAAGDVAAIAEDVALVRSAVPDSVLKVILETAAFPAVVVRTSAEAALAGGADLVKTSTGFHPAGGATVESVALLRSTVGNRAGVKASGGIRDLATARALLDAGADRLGCSATAAILDELR
jgi:deoxyribose-phosphate aldolase